MCFTKLQARNSGRMEESVSGLAPVLGMPDALPLDIPVALARLSHQFPFGCIPSEDLDNYLFPLYSALPPQARAWTLYETYWTYGTLSYRPMLRDEIEDDFLVPIYDALARKDYHSICPHRLAVLFVIFAYGSLYDLSLIECEFFDRTPPSR